MSISKPTTGAFVLSPKQADKFINRKGFNSTDLLKRAERLGKGKGGAKSNAML